MGLPEIPGATLVFGLAGALAVVTIAAFMDTARAMRWLAYCGRNSLVIYLSFFLPMAATRVTLLRTGLVSDVGAMSAIVTAAAVAAPLAASALSAGRCSTSCTYGRRGPVLDAAPDLARRFERDEV